MRDPRGSDPLAERAAVSPDEEALVDLADGRALSYRALDEAVAETAGRLAALGVGPGDHVGLLAGTGVLAVRTIYAALRLGAVPAPLGVRDEPGELAAQVDAADLVAVVAEPRFADAALDAAATTTHFPDVALPGPVPDVLERDDRAATVSLDDLEPAPFEPAAPGPDDVRLMLFTSGTTGDPKAVQLTARNLRTSALASALRLGVEPDDRWLVPLSIHHMGGFAPVFRSVMYGTTAILQAEFDAGGTLAALAEHDATALSVVPTMLRRLLDAAADGSTHTADADADAAGADVASVGVDGASALSDLRFVLSGGAATPPELVERCAEADVPLCPTYGVTETASQVATALPAEAREHPETVGRPLLPVEVAVVDEDGAALPLGESGEVVVDGPTVSPGYYGDPEATEASRSELGYHTGDHGVLRPDGRLRVLGRLDDVIVTGGENVAPARVADALREHAAVEDAAVLGLDDPEWGERVAALVAGDLAPDEVREHAEDRLAGYQRPRTVAVVDELPRTASGTVDRDAARELLREDGVEV